MIESLKTKLALSHIGRTPPAVSHYVYVQTPDMPHDSMTAQS